MYVGNENDKNKVKTQYKLTCKVLAPVDNNTTTEIKEGEIFEIVSYNQVKQMITVVNIPFGMKWNIRIEEFKTFFKEV